MADKMKKNYSKIALKIVGFIIGLVGLYVVSIVLFVLSPNINNFLSRTEFDSEKWKNWVETETSPSLRLYMVHDLIDDYELVGMEVTEIKSLLGEPTSESRKSLSYYLGMSGHGIDTGTLFLELTDGVVTHVEVWHG